jgi:hypothetical protein
MDCPQLTESEQEPGKYSVNVYQMHYVTSSHTWYDVTKHTRQLQGIFTKKVGFLKTIKLVITGFLHAPLQI